LDQFLWYFIPGAISMVPVVALMLAREQSGSLALLGGAVLVLGYVIQTTYRFMFEKYERRSTASRVIEALSASKGRLRQMIVGEYGDVFLKEIDEEDDEVKRNDKAIVLFQWMIYCKEKHTTWLTSYNKSVQFAYNIGPAILACGTGLLVATGCIAYLVEGILGWLGLGLCAGASLLALAHPMSEWFPRLRGALLVFLTVMALAITTLAGSITMTAGRDSKALVMCVWLLSALGILFWMRHKQQWEFLGIKEQFKLARLNANDHCVK